MKPLSVEDGTNEVCKWCGCMLPVGMYATCFKSPTRWCERPAAVPVANLDELLRNVRSATPEELTAQAESLGENYKPGPRQPTPFMPEATTPTGQSWQNSFKNFHQNLCKRFGYFHDEKDWYRDQISLEEHIAKLVAQPVESPTLPVPERTAEMEEAMKVLRATADWCIEASGQDWEDDLIELKMCASAAPRTILRLLDHIEGKPKLSIQEVKE